jgi:hypothetical protein
MRRSALLGLALAILGGCDSGSGRPDSGAVHFVDAGFIHFPDGGQIELDSGSRADGADADADAGLPEPDAGLPAPDAGLPAPDAGLPPPDAGVPAADSGSLAVDSGALTADSGPVAPDAAPPLDAAPIPDTGPAIQTGELAITEILPASSSHAEYLELLNTTSAAIDLTRFTLAVASKQALGPAPIRAAQDPTGALGSRALLPPGGYAIGVPNPPPGTTISASVAFVFGTPDLFLGDAFADGGDLVVLGGPRGTSDALDFRRTAAGPAVGRGEFPLLPDVALTLDPSSTSSTATVSPALANDDGSAWCAPAFRGGSPGTVNLPCNAFLLSELTVVHAGVGGVDATKRFIEIAGPAGGPFTNLRLVALGPMAELLANVPLAPGRAPLSGLFVLAEDATTPNAGQLASLPLSAAGGSVELVRRAELLDACGWGSIPTGAVDPLFGLPAVLGAPLPTLVPVAHPLNWARSDSESTSGDDQADFRYAPEPSPGTRNGAPHFAFTAIAPDNALLTATATVILRGTELGDGTRAETSHFGGPQPAACVFVEPNALSCRMTYGARAPNRIAVGLAASALQGSLLSEKVNAFTWTVVANGAGMPTEIDYVVLQFPPTVTVAAGSATPLIYGRIYQAGLTDTMAGPIASISAELGVGPAGSDPTRSNSWTWLPAVFNPAQPMMHNQEYMATFTPAAAGALAYTFRFSLDGGMTWTYSDLDGAGSNPGLSFDASNLGAMTVTP